MNLKKEVTEWVIAIVVAIAVVFLVTKFIVSSYSVNGLSIHPTFNNDDKVIVSKISKRLNHLNGGDVIVFHENSKHDYIKRLIGKPGDTVEYKTDQLYVNGKKLMSLI